MSIFFFFFFFFLARGEAKWGTHFVGEKEKKGVLLNRP